MHSTTTAAASVLAAIAALPAVYAHGYVENAIVGGKTIFVGSPQWMYNPPNAAGWYANNQDNGFVAPDEYTNADIICHKAATPGPAYLTVAAGSTMGLQWNTWPDSHHGPVINDLAAAGITDGDFSKVDKTSLKFFNAQSVGLLNDSPPPGSWATDTLIANNFTGEFTIPASIAPGYYVLRHEIIGLHSAGNADGAQNYPQCVNLKITGSGTVDPCAAGADCRVGTKFYTPTDPGILIDIYSPITSYKMPGPVQWSGSGSGTSPAQPTSAAPTSAAPTTMKTTVKPTTAAPPTSTKAPATSTTAPSTGSCAAKYQQCGGSGFTGPTCCAAGSTCTASGTYYSQCL